MKVYLNRKPVHGPWGGGSKVLIAIIKALTNAGHEVVHELVAGIDVLFCFDPRQGNENGLVGYNEIFRYAFDVKNKKNERPRIVQRVGDVGTHGKPDLLNLVLASAYHSDTVIFPSVWAHDFVVANIESLDARVTKQWHVILNAPTSTFYKNRSQKLKIDDSISFVSHHWSTNDLKGFAFYKQLDNSIEKSNKFTFYGRVPQNVNFKHSPVVLNAEELASELPKHDIYVTASELEAGANHVLEAIACGLPVIYHQNGGSINEYCQQYGASFDGTIDSFNSACEQVLATYPRLKKNIKKYRMTIDDQALKYVAVIESVKA